MAKREICCYGGHWIRGALGGGANCKLMKVITTTRKSEVKTEINREDETNLWS